MLRIPGRAARSLMALLSVSFLACDDAAVVTTPVPVATVAVTPATHSILVGSKVTLRAKPLAADGQELERPVTWSSEDETIATVSSTGEVTSIAIGQVGIRATSGGRFGRAVLVITPLPPVPVAEVRLSVDDEVVLAWDGETEISASALDAQGNVLDGRAVTWHSSRTSVVAVNHGRLFAVHPGSAIVTAIIEGKAASVGVRVTEAPITSLRIVGPTTALELNDLMPFAAEIIRANGELMYGPVEWSSSRPDIVAVEHSDFTGATLGARAEGEATITVAREGIQATMTLTVTERPSHDIIYSRWNDTESRIMHLGLATEGLAPVALNAGAVSSQPSPSPDGTQFVFTVAQVGMLGDMQNDLYIVRRDGLNMRRLTSMPGIEDGPRWSPDGTKILFRAIIDDISNIYTVNVDGTGLTNITAGLPEDLGNRREPAWSPDGLRIAFIAARGMQHKVWMIDVDGSNLKQVTTDAGFDMTPTFSPDGKKIAFTRYSGAEMGDDIMISSIKGGAPLRLALPGDQRNPAWSPDGKLIAVSGNAAVGQRTYIYTMRPDGTGLRLRTLNPAWYGAVGPAWIKR